MASEKQEPIPEMNYLRPSPTKLKLLMDAGTRILSLFDSEKGEMVVQKRLTRNEWTLLMVFEENHPHYAPNEMLLSSLTSLSPDVCRMRIHEAQEKGTDAVKRELKPVYRALSSLRKKLKAIYQPLDITLLRGTGYVLRVARDVDEQTGQEGNWFPKKSGMSSEEIRVCKDTKVRNV